jgi:predicted HicB family RNase H-like nuclease
MNQPPPIPDPDETGPAERRTAQRRQHERRTNDHMMTLNIEVTPETHVQLQEKAQQQGKTLDEYLRDLMEREVSND